MRLCLIRHAMTSWNEEGRIQGQTDTELSDRGRRQIEGWRLPPGFTTACCVTSPLKRARDTARLLGLRAERTDTRLMEMNWGEFEGKKLADLRVSPDTEMADLEARGLDFRPPGGESPREVAGRLASFCADMAAAGDGDVVAVAHKGLLRAALVIACGWDMQGKPPVRFDPERALLLDVASDGSLSLASVVDLRA